MISNTTVKGFENEDETKIDWTLIKKFLKILSVLLIIFTIIFFTCFGCFLVLNDSTSWAAQTVTLSSEGGANETYPDSMGEYQLAGEIRGYDWYRHKDRENEFLLYATGKFRIVMRISCKVVYYLVIAMVAYITTRDQGDFFAESDLSNMETHVTPSFRYKLVWAFVVFGVLVM